MKFREINIGMKDKLTDEQHKSLENWDPDKAKTRGTLKVPVEIGFDVKDENSTIETEFQEPKKKIKKKVKATVIEPSKKRNNGELF